MSIASQISCLAAEPLFNYYEDIIVSGDNHYNPFKRDFHVYGSPHARDGWS